jgi:hypothetical protein
VATRSTGKIPSETQGSGAVEKEIVPFDTGAGQTHQRVFHGDVIGRTDRFDDDSKQLG